MIDDEAAGGVRKWILLVLSTLTKSRVFQYDRGPLQYQWFMRIPKDVKETDVWTMPCWGQAGYTHNGISALIVDDFSAIDAPPISLVESNLYFETETPRQYVIGQTSDIFDLPDRIDLLAVFRTS